MNSSTSHAREAPSQFAAAEARGLKSSVAAMQAHPLSAHGHVWLFGTNLFKFSQISFKIFVETGLNFLNFA
jgi:hypothetical protein